MKTHDIQRGITSPNGREGGGPPQLGRVTRLRDTGHATGTRRIRRRGERGLHPRGGGMDKKTLVAWILIGGGATLGVIALAFVFWLKPRLERQNAALEMPIFQREARVRVVSEYIPPGPEKSVDIVRHALTNRDPEQVSSVVRLGKASVPEVLDFFERAREKDGAVVHYDWRGTIDVDGLMLDVVVVFYAGDGRPVERLALLTPDANGNWKMDFGAYARSVDPSWDELLKHGADQALVRAFVHKDVYYNGPFIDESQWVCYTITSPDTEEHLRGYCRRGSDVAEEMEKRYSAPAGGLKRATLELRSVEGAETNQFEIIRLAASDWVVTGT